MKEKSKLQKVKTTRIGLKESNFYSNLLILEMIKIERYKNQINLGLILLVMLPIIIINWIEILTN